MYKLAAMQQVQEPKLAWHFVKSEVRAHPFEIMEAL